MNLEEFKIFKNVPLEIYKKRFKIITYNKEEMIFNEGDECNYISFVLEGKISVRTYTLNDKEEIINTLLPGNIFGDIICFSENRSYIGHVIADKTSTVAHIHRDSWLNLLQENSHLLLHFIESITNKTFKTKMENKILVHKNIEDRIYYYLNTLVHHKKNSFVNIKSVTDLSKILNLPRPSVSRTLKSMEEKGIIIRNKNRIEVL